MNARGAIRGPKACSRSSRRGRVWRSTHISLPWTFRGSGIRRVARVCSRLGRWVSSSFASPTRSGSSVLTSSDLTLAPAPHSSRPRFIPVGSRAWSRHRRCRVPVAARQPAQGVGRGTERRAVSAGGPESHRVGRNRDARAIHAVRCGAAGQDGLNSRFEVDQSPRDRTLVSLAVGGHLGQRAIGAAKVPRHGLSDSLGRRTRARSRTSLIRHGAGVGHSSQRRWLSPA